MIPFFSGMAKLLRGGFPAPPGVDDELFRSLAENSADVLCRVDPDGVFTYVSPSALAMFGVRSELMVGTSAITHILPEDRPTILAARSFMKSGENEETRNQVRAVRADGRVVWVEASTRRVRGQQAASAESILVLRDITDRKHLEEQLASEALEDGLTGIANRRALDRALADEWRRTVRTGTQMALILLDVDHFKKFNDFYGHQAGDDCLRAIAVAAKAGARRAGDLAARYGGEEFAVMLSNTEGDAATATAEAIRSSVEALGIHQAGLGAGMVVTVSVGVADVLARSGGTIKMPETLLQAADNALYRAKAGGRNRVDTALLITPNGMPS